jgi:uncharacterized protein YgbK (DUF1537 family)
VLVGSHVAKTSAQLDYLLAHSDVVAVHVDVAQLALDDVGARTTATAALADNVIARVGKAHADGKTAVIYTSREELQFPSQAERLAFGERVSALLMIIVGQLPESIGFLISKGGITSNDVLSTGLALRSSRVLGQILTGCSVVRCPADHARYPDLPVVIFPGNVGDKTSLAQVYAILTAEPRHMAVQHNAAYS